MVKPAPPHSPKPTGGLLRVSGQAALCVQGTVSAALVTGSAAVKSIDEETHLKPFFKIMIGFYSPHLKDFTKKLYCQSQTIY